MTAPTQSLAGLPMLLAALAERTSVPTVLRLADVAGGTRRYIPEKLPTGKHWLVDAIGVEATEVLIEMVGGDEIEVPTLRAYKAQKQHIAVAEGSAREVALRFGVTERWVRECRSLVKDSRQQSLFD